MNESRLFKFEKDHFETRHMIFIAKALAKTEKDSYRVWMEKIYCDGKRIIATDGHRCHIYTPDECPLPVGLFTVEKKTKNCIYVSLNSMDATYIESYPDIDKVIPKEKKAENFKHAGVDSKLAEVVRAMGDQCVNIKYFIDAVSLDNIFEFQVTDAISPVVMYGKEMMSIIMPMRDNQNG